jgi:methylmalonyl-CoA/ethylmalonyl-CoA epimerase
VSHLRRLDHVAIVVRDTDEALRFYRDHLGLRVVSSEEIPAPRVRLTHLDAGNAYVQLVEPLTADSALAQWLDEHGEGLHHLCFGVDDVPASIAELSDVGSSVTLGSGRGRVSGFVATTASHGAAIELTEFVESDDVQAMPGWLDGGRVS